MPRSRFRWWVLVLLALIACPVVIFAAYMNLIETHDQHDVTVRVRECLIQPDIVLDCTTEISADITFEVEDLAHGETESVGVNQGTLQYRSTWEHRLTVTGLDDIVRVELSGDDFTPVPNQVTGGVEWVDTLVLNGSKLKFDLTIYRSTKPAAPNATVHLHQFECGPLVNGAVDLTSCAAIPERVSPFKLNREDASTMLVPTVLRDAGVIEMANFSTGEYEFENRGVLRHNGPVFVVEHGQSPIESDPNDIWVVTVEDSTGLQEYDVYFVEETPEATPVATPTE